MTMRTKSALSYFGSDSEHAAALASKLDHCTHVTIPFVGGASILPHLKARAIVANDLNNAAINFYRCMSNLKCRTWLIDRCSHTLSHPDEIDTAWEFHTQQVQASPAEMAWAYWALCWIGRKGKGGTKQVGGMPSVRRTANGGSNASRLVAAAADLQAWAKHFARCEWQQVCFRELIPQIADHPDCGVYCDPPWIGAGGGYLHAFTDDDHWALSLHLQRFKETTVVVRYGDHPRIRELYKGWDVTEVASRTQANNQTPEIWLCNRGQRMEELES